MAYTEKDREALIEYWKWHLEDLIPYDDHRYEEKLQEWAESCAESDINPVHDFVALCEYHDRWMEEEENKVKTANYYFDITNKTN